MKFMSVQSEEAISLACKNIEICNIANAVSVLHDSLVADLDNSNLLLGIKYCNFWNDTLSSLSSLSFFEQGEVLLGQWKQFSLLVKEGNCSETILYSFRKGIFSLALECYSKANDEKDARLKSEILRKIGLCYKKLGSFEVALQYLQDANVTLAGQAAVIAEMADCYALCGETKTAKMLFKEAFYTDAQKIEFCFLDSPLILVLVDKVQAMGYTGAVLQEWVAVYGVVFGVFNVKRVLRSQEVLRLKQEIYAKESELKDPSNNRELILPRLANLYFWLLDHYSLAKEGAAKINEVLLKLKILDADLYKKFAN